MDTIYKKKDQKMKSINLDKSNNTKLEGYID